MGVAAALIMAILCVWAGSIPDMAARTSTDRLKAKLRAKLAPDNSLNRKHAKLHAPLTRQILQKSYEAFCSNAWTSCSVLLLHTVVCQAGTSLQANLGKSQDCIALMRLLALVPTMEVFRLTA